MGNVLGIVEPEFVVLTVGVFVDDVEQAIGHARARFIGLWPTTGARKAAASAGMAHSQKSPDRSYRILVSIGFPFLRAREREMFLLARS